MTILRYRPEIDGLRALSIVAVLLFHAFPIAFPGGFIGVDIFFVISGYLITAIIRQGLERQDFSFSEFYTRRIRRIFPALIIVLCSSLLFGWFALLPDEYASLGKHTFGTSILVPNFFFWSESGYFDIDNKLKPLLHLWSIGVEEQFYLFWPILLVAAVSYRVKLGFLVLALILLSFFACILPLGVSDSALFFLPQFRAWELLLGAGLSLFGSGASLARIMSYQFSSVLATSLGLLVFLCSLVLIRGGDDYPGILTLLPTMSAALLILAGARNSLAKFILCNKASIWVGKISYPLYLWHWPILSYARIMESGEPSLSVKLFALLLSFLLSAFTLHCVERPLRDRHHPSIAFLLTISLGLTGSFGYLISSFDGVPTRVEYYQNKLAMFEWRDDLTDACPDYLNDLGPCLSSGNDHQVAVIGDSHSVNVFYALADHYTKMGTSVLRFGRGGCPPIYGVEVERNGLSTQCRSSTGASIDYVTKNADIHTVFLSFMSRYLSPEQGEYVFKPRPGLTVKPTNEVFINGLQQTIDLLVTAGKRVVIVLDWPRVTFDPRSCVRVRPLQLTGKIRESCSIEKSQYLKENRTYRNKMMSILSSNPGLGYWDTAKVLCGEARCWVKKDSMMLYRDHTHLSLTGARYLGDNISIEWVQ